MTHANEGMMMKKQSNPPVPPGATKPASPPEPPKPSDTRRVDSELVEDWIVDIAMRDRGKVLWAATSDNERAPVTYGDLRKLIRIVD